MPDWLLRLFGRKVRGFEVVADWARKVPDAPVRLPERSTQNSAAYDFFSLESGIIMPGRKREFATDVKMYMRPDEVLHLYTRSSQGIILDLQLAHSTGVIDADFYENPQNDGGITIMLRNLGDKPVKIEIGDKVAQGEFAKYLRADNDKGRKLPKRKGGVGHTGR